MTSFYPTEAPVPEPAPTPLPLVVAVTGHRPDKLGGYKVPNPLYDIVVTGLVDAFQKLKPAYVITGMALGVDQWAAEIAFNMGIPFVAAIPFDGQDTKWFAQSKAKYQWLLSKAFERRVISPGPFTWQKMHTRNKWMVDSCHHLIAVFNGSPGGTANCVGYAQGLGKPIWFVPLPPIGIEVSSIQATVQKSTIVEDLMKEEQQKKEEEAQKLKGPGRIVEI